MIVAGNCRVQGGSVRGWIFARCHTPILIPAVTRHRFVLVTLYNFLQGPAHYQSVSPGIVAPVAPVARLPVSVRVVPARDGGVTLVATLDEGVVSRRGDGAL